MYSELAEGHPIRTYLHETELIQNLLEEIMQTDPEKDYQKFYNLFNHLSSVEKRFQRKENQLFPFLEQKGYPLSQDIQINQTGWSLLTRRCQKRTIAAHLQHGLGR